LPQEKLDEALRCILQEDPSLSISTDAETSQTLLRGMGELHLDIVYRRLVDDYKVAIHILIFLIDLVSAIRIPRSAQFSSIAFFSI
jgi:elongation factor G